MDVAVLQRMAANHKSFFTRCCEEPFRIFFPLGVLVGISGVSLWPLFFSGLHKFYPGVMHARLMIEGFLGAFIIGFLGTAGLRLTGPAHFSRAELWSLLALYAGAVGTHIAERYFVADVIFLGLLLTFATLMRSRFSRYGDLSPSFALVAFGFLNAIIGTILLLLGATGEGFPRCAMLGALLLSQGFVLYLALGIGGLLLSQSLTLPAKPELLESPDVSPPFVLRTLFVGSISAVLLASFFVEVFAETPRLAAILRCAAAGVFLVSGIPSRLSLARSVTISRCLSLAIVLLVLGLLFPVLWPWQRVAGLHVSFIGGFTLMTFTAATHVVLDFSEPGEPALQPLAFLRSAAALLVIAAVFRVAGDFVPALRGTLLNVASYLWMLAAAVWSWRVLPKVRLAHRTSSS